MTTLQSPREFTDLLLDGRYQLGELLEQGTLSTVYRGQDTVLHRPIAVKVVPSELVAVYRNALQVTSALTHPAIVATYDAIEQDNRLFLIQELVVARPLTQYLSNGLPSERALDLCAQLARALVYTHSHHVTHGDLTPTAVLVDRRAVIRINNVALPPDMQYFAAVSSTLPASADETSDAAYPLDEDTLATPAGDVRAVGLLLWQFLTMPAQTDKDKDTDSLPERTFRQDVPEDVRSLTLRCVQPTHTQAITDAEALTLALEMEKHALQQARSPLSEETPPALRAAREAVAQMAAWSIEETLGTIQSLPDEERVSAGHTRRADDLDSSQRAPQTARFTETTLEEPIGQPRIRLPSRPVDDPLYDSYPTMAADDSRNEPTAWPLPQAARQRMAAGLNLYLVLLLGLVLFVLAFLFGFLMPALLGSH